MKKRDRGQTPTNTSLVAGWDEAVSREIMELKADTASAFCLDGEGTSKNKEEGKSKEISKSELEDTARLIPNNTNILISNKIEDNNILNRKVSKVKYSKKNNYRVPVLYPDGKPGMPTTNKRANKWLKEGKAEIVKNKLNIFAIKLKFWPKSRNSQPIVLCIDPGSAFTGIAVMSRKCILISYMLELPGYKRGSKPFIVTNRHGKKIEKYHNTIVQRMEDRSRLRRSRRHRNCRRRECRFLNRSKKGKIAPSMLAKKQLELEMTKELSKLYPVSIIGFEDVSFNHYKDKDGTKGMFFSQVEVGKNWLLDRLKVIAPVQIVKGYETSIRREQLKLPKERNKTRRSKASHVTDCIAIGSVILGPGINMINKFKFDVISRPKYTRRILFAEQPNKAGITERAGGHIPHTSTFKGLKKGDYVEARAPSLKKVYRGWISGYTNDRIYVSSFDWDQYPSFSVNNIKLLDRNHGLISLRLSWIKDTVDICEFGTIQQGIDGGKMIKIQKEKSVRKEEIKNDNMSQLTIDKAWG